MEIRLSDHFTYSKLLKFVFPTIIMMIITSIYSIVDGFFVSNFVGKNAFAAVNLIMPALTGLVAFGFMIGTGGSALIGKTLGEGHQKRANQYFTMLIYVTIVVGIILSILGFIFIRPISQMLGATSSIIEECVIYGRTILFATTFYMLQSCFQSFLVTAEKPKMGLIISLTSGVMNMVLDFLFVYVFQMGIFGAALATALSQCVGGIIPLIYFFKENTSLLHFVKTKFDFQALKKACFNGSSEMLTNLSASLVGILYNYQLIRIAAENGVVAYGVIMYVNFVFMSLFFGYQIGVSPIVSYHYGAQNTQELKNIFHKSIILIIITSLLMTITSYILSLPLSQLYVGYDIELIKMTTTGMKIYAFSFLICGFNIFGSAFFTALNNGLISAIISILRTLVFQVLAILILPYLWGLNGVWFAIVVAEGLTFIVTVLFLFFNRKKYQYV